jgi:hypothetical protein
MDNTTDFAQEVAKLLGVKETNEVYLLDEIQTKLQEREFARKKATEWENRFTHLSQVTECSEEQVRQAFDAIPSSQKSQLLTWLDTQSSNFMGTGLSFHEFIWFGRAQEISNNLFNQSREEQRRRMDYIIRASKTLYDIREVNRFATGFGEMAIEDIIKGDLRNLRRWRLGNPVIVMENRAEKGPESDQNKFYRNLWEPFVAIIREAIETWPIESDKVEATE